MQYPISRPFNIMLMSELPTSEDIISTYDNLRDLSLAVYYNESIQCALQPVHVYMCTCVVIIIQLELLL
jgi:hypothetical protein